MPGKSEINGIEVEWINHSSVKLENSLVVYIDVFEDAFESPKWKKGDLFLSTHDHYDHFDSAMINALAKDDAQAVIFQDSDDKFLDIESIKVASGEVLEVKGINIETVPAYNKGKDFHPEGEGVGYVFELDGKKIYYAGDTDFIEEMKHLEDEEIDLAFLPIGGKYTMNVEEAAKAALTIEPKIVIPTHYNFIEDTEADPEEFKRKVEEESDIEVRIL